MTLRIGFIVSALVPALGAATAMALPAPQAFAQFGQAGITYQSSLLGPYDQAGAMVASAAYVGNGSDASHPDVLHEPVYEFNGGA
jgi:uncharacterized membrane protein